FKYLRNGRATGWPRANFFAAARLLGFATCFFLLVYWKEAMDLGSQAFGPHVWALILISLPVLALGYLFVRFAVDRRLFGWPQAVLLTSLRVGVFLFLALVLILRGAGPPAGTVEISGLWWLVLLIPVLVAAFGYVAWMYVHDAAVLGWAWASFLGALRVTVFL